jgi:hypothetical protein
MNTLPMPSPRSTNRAGLYIKSLDQVAPSPRHGLVRDEITPALRRKLQENMFREMREYEDKVMAREMRQPKRLSEVARHAADQAMQAMRRRARDEEYDGQSLQDLVAWIIENCSPAEMASVANALRERVEASAASDDWDLREQGNRQEQISGDPDKLGPFNYPTPTLLREQKGAEDGFFRRFPAAKRIAVDNMGVQSDRSRQRAGSGAAFFARFPGAKRIDIL